MSDDHLLSFSMAKVVNFAHFVTLSFLAAKKKRCRVAARAGLDFQTCLVALLPSELAASIYRRFLKLATFTPFGVTENSNMDMPEQTFQRLFPGW